MLSMEALMSKPTQLPIKNRFGASLFGSDVLDDATKQQLGIGQPKVDPPAPEFMGNHEEGFDNQKQVPRTEGVDIAPEWMRRQEQVDVAPEFMKQKPITTYIGPNAKGWNDTDEGKFSSLADKKERREISDEGFRLYWDKMPEGVISNLGWNTKHDEAYRNYPELKDKKFIKNPSISGMLRGSYGNNEINIDPTLGPNEASSTTLHEIQHAIQEKEGFAGGANPQEFQIPEESYRRAESELKAVAQAKMLKQIMKDHGVEVGDARRIYEKNFEDDLHEYAGQYAKYFSPEELEKHEKIQNDVISRAENDPYETYRHHAGEVEARDVQARKDMPMSQRLQTQPYASQGIPVNKQIVRVRPVIRGMTNA